MHRIAFNFAGGLGALLLAGAIAGCAADKGPDVPGHATLLSYHQGNITLQQRPAPGQYWLYDETAGRVVSVVTIPSTNDAVTLKFTDLNQRHWYRLYLVSQQAPTELEE